MIGVVGISHQVIWTKLILERFIAEGNLTKFEEMVMRTRVAGWSRVKQHQEFHCSLATIDRTIRVLKRKYDEVQKYDPILPPRKFSMQELYQDTGITFDK